MQKIITAILLCSLLFASYGNCYGQTNHFQNLLDSAKAEFVKEDFAQQDYVKAATYLEEAVKLNPDDPEARYFLGYAYSRINSKDGRSMINSDLTLTLKASEEFEKVNKLSPKYTGEIVLLDPYSKISSEWGSLAMSYWHNHKPDSTRWAFAEGKKRGGFNEYILAMNRKILNTCDKNAILFSSGDNSTFYLWYLQITENNRTDVAVIDRSLLESRWYPTYLANNHIVSFDISDTMLDTLDYCLWTDKMMNIGNFSWEIIPYYYDHYLFRGDRIFLSMLKQNNFERNVYFTLGFPFQELLGLRNYFKSLIVLYKLNHTDEPELSYDDGKKRITEALKLSAKINTNSKDELNILNGLRSTIIEKIGNYLNQHENKKAQELIKLMDTYIPEAKYPIRHEALENYLDMLRKIAVTE